MTNIDLARSYIQKAEARLKALALLHAEGDYSDVVREAQETVELALKAMLRAIGVDPPKFHDVGGIILEHCDRFQSEVTKGLGRAAEISKWLRKERELALYGAIDFIPTEEYTAEDAQRALDDTRWVVQLAKEVIVK